jgi:hypothetical protein
VQPAAVYAGTLFEGRTGSRPPVEAFNPREAFRDAILANLDRLAPAVT